MLTLSVRPSGELTVGDLAPGTLFRRPDIGAVYLRVERFQGVSCIILHDSLPPCRCAALPDTCPVSEVLGTLEVTL